jgi:hypothetical protein
MLAINKFFFLQDNFIFLLSSVKHEVRQLMCYISALFVLI